MATSADREKDKLRVDAGIPGGNIVVDKIAGDDVYVHQDLRDTKGHWFYWHFRVRGAEGRSLTFHFTKGDVIGVHGPAVSTDAGKSWRWLGAKAVRGPSFHFDFPADASDVRFCFAFPYTEENLRTFLARFKNNANLKVESLGKSKKGRDIIAVRLGRLDGKATHRIALTCRHHACESMASFALEGIIETVLGDSEHGRWLRENVEFFIVPLVDGDGVEDGDQGKNRIPFDHNRDYQGESIYPQVHAIRQRLPAWAQGKLRIALDLHCPGPSGAGHEAIYFVGGPSEVIWKEIGSFSKMLETVQSGPLVFRSKDNLPFGHGWNTKAAFGDKTSFARWAGALPGVMLAATIEIAYANANGDTVTDASAHALGHDLAHAFRDYLRALGP